MDEILEQVVKQIIKDDDNRDYTAIYELLCNLPIKYLESFLEGR